MEKRSTISVIINGVFYVGSCIVTKSGINDDVIYCSVPGSTEMPKLVFLRDLPLPHCTAIILSAHQSVCVDEKYLALLISASECDVVEDVKVTVYGKGNRNRLQLLISFISRGTPYFALVDDAMSIAANPNLPYEERKALLSEVRKVIMPECPKGKRYSRNTFWQQFDERMILRWAIMGGTDEKIESCAKWLDENKHKMNRSVVFAPALT